MKRATWEREIRQRLLALEGERQQIVTALAQCQAMLQQNEGAIRELQRLLPQEKNNAKSEGVQPRPEPEAR